MNDTIRLIGLTFVARHGNKAEEKTLYQPFEVDVEISCDLSKPSESDRLKDTVDYSKVARIVEGVVKGESCNLIEKIAGIIIARVCEIVPRGIVTVRVRKPRAPLAQTFDTVEVELCRETGQ